MTDTKLGTNLVFVSLSPLPYCEQDLDQNYLPRLGLEHKIIDFFVRSNMKVYLEIEVEDQEVNERVGGRVNERE